MPRKVPPPLPPVPQPGDEFGTPPEFSRGIMEATTGPRDLAKFLGPPSRVVTPKEEGC